MRESWWLMDCSFPDLVWARLRVREDGVVEVVSAGNRHAFADEETARHWLAEDEFIPLSDLDDPAIRREYGLDQRDIHPPAWPD